LPWWQRREVLLGGALLACGLVVGLLIGLALGRRTAPVASLALPGNTWRLKYQDKEPKDPFRRDSFLEFREDGTLVEIRTQPGGTSSGDLGKYRIVDGGEIALDIPAQVKWRVAGGRFAVVMAGENLILESRANSERVYLHHLTQADDEPGRHVAQEGLKQLRDDVQRQESMSQVRHMEVMNQLRQIASKPGAK
jgi:hypothetical protein